MDSTICARDYTGSGMHKIHLIRIKGHLLQHDTGDNRGRLHD